MQANEGDRLVIGSHRIGQIRTAIVLEARGPDGKPPYLVRWMEDDHESLFYPGPDTIVEPVDSSKD